mgnify:CR=1 FL=1
MAVNLMWCVPGQVGGSEEYLVRQLLGMSEIEHWFEITVFAGRGYSAAHPDVADRYRIIETDRTLESRPRRVLMENTWLAKNTRGHALVHHGGGTMPAIGNRSTVLTVHDLQYLSYPQYQSALKLRYLKATVPSSIRRATVVAVPSEYVRGSVVSATGVGADDVLVVPHGMEPSIGVDATPEDVLRRKLGLGSGPVLVYPGITHPHKNHLFLLELLASKWTDPSLRVVFAGGKGLADEEVTAAIARLGVGDRVVRPGRVSDDDRDGLLKMALGVVFPSEYEGFGAPVIEAMALGVPVACSDRASLPEVAGEAGIVRPLTLDSWANIPEMMQSDRANLVAKGHARATQFTSRISGEAILRAYESCIAR